MHLMQFASFSRLLLVNKQGYLGTEKECKLFFCIYFKQW